ncbi:FbpB family small basic protein [Sporolactobacillus sp. CPB3-1]|uniref:FbpB family small basic protein n=1 Tax=Sporolactobacillus mangiferae TaxID=2940498 RepID=A0ABT0M9H6_9BACL|nr:FbpB family small basic protein [Sporolactobacillus mangiferae]MCL1631526.1 FbpB family small basic protein [Sporolactobacillus mangiferae]
MRKKETFMQLVKRNKEEILRNGQALSRIDRILDERRLAAAKVSGTK